MTVEIVSILEELNELRLNAIKQANQVPSNTLFSSYHFGYADALRLAWDIVFNKAHMSEEDINIK